MEARGLELTANVREHGDRITRYRQITFREQAIDVKHAKANALDVKGAYRSGERLALVDHAPELGFVRTIAQEPD